MSAARVLASCDRASFEFDAPKMDRALVEQLAEMADITRHAKLVRFCSTVDLGNALEREKPREASRAHAVEPPACGGPPALLGRADLNSSDHASAREAGHRLGLLNGACHWQAVKQLLLSFRQLRDAPRPKQRLRKHIQLMKADPGPGAMR